MENNLQTNYDVVVCGAGPAGAAASLFLSQQGINHLIFDQSAFPRPKVCGDGITPLCTTILKQVIPGVQQDFAEKSAVKRIRNIRLYGINFKHAELSTGDFIPEEKNKVYTISRLEFDNYLVQHLKKKAEATFWENTKLTGYTMEPDGVRLKLVQHGVPIEVFTKMVIAADGDRSPFRKSIYSTAIDRKQMVAAVRTYYKNVTPVSSNDLYEIYALKEVLPGYFWIFPMADGTHNVGLGITSDVIQEKKINLRKLMEELITTHPLLKDRFGGAEKIHAIEGSGLPIMMETEPRLSDARIVLTGDAASLADPISGEGIGPGIVSGKYAAVIAAEAIRANDFSAAFLKKYDTIIHQKITHAYEIRIRLFDWFLKHPWRINAIVWAAPKLGWIRNFLANAANGHVGVQDLEKVSLLKKFFLRKA
jgi:geranylgeranyl reductase family protein